MITFADDHEADLWQAVYTSFAAPLELEHSDCTPSEIAHDAGWHADAAVLEYRKRCGPGVIPESVDSFIRKAVNFADTVGSRAADDSIRVRASKLIENGERLLEQGDDQ